MKKKFIITEEQAKKILEQTTSQCQTLQGMPNFATCCENTIGANPYNANGWNESYECKVIRGMALVTMGLSTSQLESCCPQGGPGNPGEDPCKNPDTATEECYICRETGAGCVTLSQMGMSVQQALNANPPFTLYADVNQCNQLENCGDTEPCPPPAQGCPPGTTWNPVTCHCEGTTIGDDPCKVNPKDCWFCKSPGNPCMQFSQMTLAFTNTYGGTKYPTKQDCENNSECEPTGRDDGNGCPDVMCANPNHVQGPYPGCKCECPEGSGEKGCKKGTSWSPDECCCVDKKGICVPDNTSPTNPVNADFVGPLYTENNTKLSEQINRIKKLLK